ncbi:hypothetical protein VP1G_05612 [Cytospora mali]|uniref:Rhodopsin domain-containing protein n=1 Tax=Cytospora mali TaxID=578113 RepID=A0A194V341_CYTMA|nr:hypothetical protein VP1G_05612 [Valsa mali var. pyri (nom. inval.)]
MSLPPNVDRRTTLDAVNWSLVAVAFVFVVLRFWARMYNRALGFDDGLMLVSWLLFLVAAIIFQIAASSGGTRHWIYLSLGEMEEQEKWMVINLPIAIAVTGIGKFAVGLTTLRIFGNTSRWKKWAVWSMLFILTTVSIIDIFIALFRCGLPQTQWNFAKLVTAKCLPTQSYDIFNEFVIAVQAFSDYFFSILPMVAVWKLKMSLRRRLTVIFLLGLTLITAAVATVKMCLQIKLTHDDLTWDTLPIDICFSFEAMFIIVFGSVPVLNPLWKACTHIRLSSAGSKFTGPPKEFSSPSYKYNPPPQTPPQSPPETAVRDARWLQAGDLELARLTGYPAQPAATAGVGEWKSSDEHWKVHVHQQIHQTATPGYDEYEQQNSTM